jgi:hypothetical protein
LKVNDIAFKLLFRMSRWAVQEPVDRFLPKFERGGDDDCWPWTAAVLNRNGHGAFGIARDGKWIVVPAHRFAYEHFVGPIPAGQHVHHTCENPPCVNPAHLSLETPERHRTMHRLERCERGHDFSEANTHIDKRGNRHCRACDALRHRVARTAA